MRSGEMGWAKHYTSVLSVDGHEEKSYIPVGAMHGLLRLDGIYCIGLILIGVCR